jgi:PhnB protein
MAVDFEKTEEELKMYIPEGYGTVFPYFVVNDAARFIDFLKNAFDANEVGRTLAPNGRIANCRIRIGTSTFMVSEGDQENFKPMAAAYYLYVENADQTFAKALNHGAKKISDPMDMPYQDRQGGVTDPFGNIWWISTHLVPEPYDA